MGNEYIFRLMTAHGTGAFINKDLQLTQNNGKGVRPIYVNRSDSLNRGGMQLFVFRGSKLEYITQISNELVVSLSNKATPFPIVNNDDGSITLTSGEKFIGVRDPFGLFTLSDENSELEHLALCKRFFLNVGAYEIYRLQTSVRTDLMLDADLHVNFQAAHRLDDSPIYAQRSGNELNFFAIINNTIKYIQSIDDAGKAILTAIRVPVKAGALPFVSALGKDPKMESYHPAASPFCFGNNELDKTIYIRQFDRYWSALKNGHFKLTEKNLKREHFYVIPAEVIEISPSNIILIVFELETLDTVIARLKLERVNVVVALIEGVTPTEIGELQTKYKFPVDALNRLETFLVDRRDHLWLLSGNRIDQIKSMSKYLQRRGIEHDNIINFSVKMRITQEWQAKLDAAVESDCDFIVTGGYETAIGINCDNITNANGINLAADGQDIRQSYLIARHVIERNQAIKFVLIGLTPWALSDRGSFAACGSDCQYAFAYSDCSLEHFIFDQILNTEIIPGNESTVGRHQHSITAMLDEATTIELQNECLNQLKEFIVFCVEHGVRPIGVFMPMSPSMHRIVPNDKLKLMTAVLRMLETPDGFVFIDMCELPLGIERFSDAIALNDNGVDTFNNVLNYELRERGILPLEDMRLLDYERIYGLLTFLGIDRYNAMLERIFLSTVETIKRKDRIKVGFVLYDASMWCGDTLYNIFAQNDRYETTVFVCQRRNMLNDLTRANHKRDVEIFRERGINVVNVETNDDFIPKQDVLIFLTPYFHYLPTCMRTYMITAETLLIYMPYGLDIAYLSMVTFKIHLLVWKMFTDTKWLRSNLISNNRISETRIVYSGLPKLDETLAPTEITFEWKEAKPNAVRIIWAPHWSIVGRPYIRLSTFAMNYKFMYEYAKAHPETSWVVKPHPNLFSSAVSSGVFPSAKAFNAYLEQWNELPNAKVVAGGYYQEIFATSDALIHDCCSFVGEYQYTHKPMLYLTRKTTKLNPLGTKIIKAGYNVAGDNFEGIAHFIEDVLIAHNDTTADARREVFDAELNYQKENGVSASEMIFHTIDRSLEKNFFNGEV